MFNDIFSEILTTRKFASLRYPAPAQGMRPPLRRPAPAHCCEPEHWDLQALRTPYQHRLPGTNKQTQGRNEPVFWHFKTLSNKIKYKS